MHVGCTLHCIYNLIFVKLWNLREVVGRRTHFPTSWKVFPTQHVFVAHHHLVEIDYDSCVIVIRQTQTRTHQLQDFYITVIRNRMKSSIEISFSSIVDQDTDIEKNCTLDEHDELVETRREPVDHASTVTRSSSKSKRRLAKDFSWTNVNFSVGDKKILADCWGKVLHHASITTSIVVTYLNISRFHRIKFVRSWDLVVLERLHCWMFLLVVPLRPQMSMLKDWWVVNVISPIFFSYLQCTFGID